MDWKASGISGGSTRQSQSSIRCRGTRPMCSTHLACRCWGTLLIRSMASWHFPYWVAVPGSGTELDCRLLLCGRRVHGLSAPYHISHTYWSSLVAGYIFTFSSYHFAHGEGHLGLVALEWIPLFLLLWYQLLAKPRIGYAIGAAVTLLACSCAITSTFCIASFLPLSCLGGKPIVRERFFLPRTVLCGPMLSFLALALLMTGPLVMATLRLQLRDPLQALYAPEEHPQIFLPWSFLAVIGASLN